MYKLLISLVALCALAGSSFATTKKKPVAAAGKSRSAKAGRRTRTKGRRTAAAEAHRHYQTAPTPERYKEIQQALATKGYFHGEVNGQWGADSVDALRRFQADQNLEVDGKLGSLSLIALGLGPKRVTAQAQPTAPPAQPNQPDTSKEQ